uniref:Uncharacterized protein n=1 Tax=Anguilla anguilla TaxID=7936 RepID=A0A0E9R0E4_ANGAN
MTFASHTTYSVSKLLSSRIKLCKVVQRLTRMKWKTDCK